MREYHEAGRNLVALDKAHNGDLEDPCKVALVGSVGTLAVNVGSSDLDIVGDLT